MPPTKPTVPLEERYKRSSTEDRIYLGELVERATAGEFGVFLRHLVNGMMTEWLAYSETDTKLPAERYLGRLEGVNKLVERLEQCIEDKARLTEEAKGKQVSKEEPPAQPQGVQ